MSTPRKAVLFAVFLAASGLFLLRLRHPHEQPAPSQPALSHRTILRRGNGTEPESLDLHRARSEAALTILRDLYEGLTMVGPDGTPVLAAAERCDVSEDGRTYRFHLRAGLKWSNGEPLSAEDFVAAWQRLVDPRTAAQYADILNMVRGARQIIAGFAPVATLGVRADGARDLLVDLVDPTPYFLAVLAHPATFPLNRRSLAENGARFAKPGVLVSNGAYVLTRWDFGSHLVAERNPRYWDHANTHLDAVEYYSFADPGTELNAFRSGELDVTTTIPPAQFAWVKEHLGGALHVAPQLAVYYLGLNLRRPPFDHSPQLREALALVIDRERLVQSVTGTGETAAYAFVPAQIADYAPAVPAYAVDPMTVRVARARRLLEEAGIDRRPPVLELRYNSGELHNRIAVAVAHMWKESLGLDTRLVAEEFKVLLQDIDRGDAVQVFRASWVADYDDAFSFLQLMQSGFGINLPRYANPRYDELLARASADPDARQRRALLEQAEALMLRDQPLIPLFFYVSKHLVAARIGGWRDNPMNIVYSKNLYLTAAGGGVQ